MRLIYICTSNVCRSPIAEAIARHHVKSLNLGEISTPVVFSRGLTDGYSPWGTPAEPRMIKAAKELNVDPAIIADLEKHGSTLLTREEVLDPENIIYLVTDEHLSWTEYTVGAEAVATAKQQNRIRMIASENIPDPYFGDFRGYLEVCSLLLKTVPTSIDLPA
eukprot:m.74902 g.74902  ORF g.74902 m.74902 type:complete len:163 (+) comp16164_c0_seq1:215-703(+)